jgi:AcrR family transcriptional regulator
MKKGSSGRGRPRGAAADAASTRDALLRAGTEVFAERGFKGATAELIARRARANKAMINYHFRSKKGLYQAILTATFAEMKARLEATAAGQRSPAEQLRQFIASFGELAGERPAFPVMLLREVTSGGEHLEADTLASLTAVFGLVRGILQQGMRDGTLRKVDPLATHISIVGPLCFYFATARFREKTLSKASFSVRPPTDPEFIAHLQDMVTRGLAAAAPSRRKR